MRIHITYKMSEMNPQIECPICYEDVESSNFETLHICHSNELTHNVCNNCYLKLRETYVRDCPICRDPINQDLEYKHEKIISDIQLLSFNFSPDFIAHIRQTQPVLLPFRYYHSEGMELIRNLQVQYQNFTENT
jgi:endogenous inhibitor of DNA gyrase (YacG/DUF329 family)